jgi:hypothetical protein
VTTFTITTDDREEAMKHLYGPGLYDAVDEFITLLMRFDKHRDLTTEQYVVLDDIRKLAEILAREK